MPVVSPTRANVHQDVRLGQPVSFEIEWDDAKTRANLKKHGVPLVEALTVFVGPLACIVDGPDHSETEVRTRSTAP